MLPVNERLSEFSRRYKSFFVPFKRRKLEETKNWKLSKQRKSGFLEKKNLILIRKMGALIKNDNSLLLLDHMESYWKQKQPDCNIYAEDGCKFMIHKVGISVLHEITY